MIPGTRLLGNTALLTFTGAAAKLLFLITSMLIYRALTKEEAGLFFTAMAFAVTALLVSELGLRGYMMRDVALLRDDSVAASASFQALFSARILFMVLSLPVMAGLLYFFSYSSTVFWCAVGLWFFAAFDSLAVFYKAALRSYERMEYDAIFSFAGRLSVLGLVAALAASQKLTLTSLVLIFAIGPLLEVIGLSIILIRRSPLSLRVVLSWGKMREALRLSAPFAFIIVCGALYVRTGTFVLSRVEELSVWMGQPQALSTTAGVAVAEFNAAGRLPEALAFLPLAIVNALLPFLTRNRANTSLVTRYFNLILTYLGLFGVAVSGFIVLEPEVVIRTIAGNQYLTAVRAFQIYGAAVFFSFLQYAMANLLICLKLEKPLTNRYGLTLVVNVVLTLVFAPRFGVAGAAAAFLFSEILAAVYDLILLRKHGYRIKASTPLYWLTVGAILLVCCRVLPISHDIARSAVTVFVVTAAIGSIGYRDYLQRRREGNAVPGSAEIPPGL